LHSTHVPARLRLSACQSGHRHAHAATPAQIGSRRKTFIRKWRLKCRAVADSLEEAGDRLFTFTRLPPSQWLCSVLHIQLQAMKSRTAQLGVNHVGIVGSGLLVETLGRVRQQVPVPMNGAPLYRHTIRRRRSTIREPKPRARKPTASATRVRDGATYWRGGAAEAVGALESLIVVFNAVRHLWRTFKCQPLRYFYERQLV